MGVGTAPQPEVPCAALWPTAREGMGCEYSSGVIRPWGQAEAGTSPEIVPLFFPLPHASSTPLWGCSRSTDTQIPSSSPAPGRTQPKTASVSHECLGIDHCF